MRGTYYTGTITKEEYTIPAEELFWSAYARYEDGSEVDTVFEYNPNKGDAEQQYDLECWLIERPIKCIEYSVTCFRG